MKTFEVLVVESTYYIVQAEDKIEAEEIALDWCSGWLQPDDDAVVDGEGEISVENVWEVNDAPHQRKIMAAVALMNDQMEDEEGQSDV